MVMMGIRIITILTLHVLLLASWAPPAVAKRSGMTPSSQKKPVDGVVVHFPEGHSMGRLYIAEASPRGAWRSYCEAQGALTLPKGRTFKLTFHFAGIDDLALIKEFPPGVISVLNLRKLPVTDDQIEKIKGVKGLIALELNETDVSNRGLEALSGMNGIASLGLSGTMLTSLDALPKISTALTSLEVSRVRMKDPDRAVANIANQSRLRTLCLNNIHLTDNGLVHISKLKALQTLEVRLNEGITDSGMIHLQNLSNLLVLDLTGTKVTSHSLKYLQKIPHLSVVRVDMHQLGKTQIALLQRGLPKCQILEGMNKRGIPLEVFDPLH